MFKIINPISFASSLKDETLRKTKEVYSQGKNNDAESERIKKTKNEIEDLITTICDICIKSLERYEEKIAFTYLEKLGDIIYDHIHTCKNLEFSNDILYSYNRIFRHTIKNKNELKHRVLNEYISILSYVHILFDTKNLNDDISDDFNNYLKELFNANKLIIENDDYELFKDEIEHVSLTPYIQEPKNTIDFVHQIMSQKCHGKYVGMYLQIHEEIDLTEKNLYLSFSNYEAYPEIIERFNELLKNVSRPVNNSSF